MKSELAEKKDSANEQLSALLDSLGEKLAELAGSVGGKSDTLIDATNEKLGALSKFAEERFKEETGVMSKLGERLKVLKAKREFQEKKMISLKVRMLKRNPTATSRKFAEEFSALRTEQMKRYELHRQERREERKKRKEKKK